MSGAAAAKSDALHERDAPAIPTQEGPLGIRFDYNDGCRVLLPKAAQAWTVCLTDLSTANVLYLETVESGLVRSLRRHYLPIRIEVSMQDGTPVMQHDFAARHREVLIQFPAGALGDTLAWFPAAARFARQHSCRLTCSMRDRFIPLFQAAYPDITLVTAEEVEPERFYATYKIMLYYGDHQHEHQPSDYQLISLQHAACYLLGVDAVEERPRLAVEDDSRPIPEPYVCIAVQSTAQCKTWNNPHGWHEVVGFLQQAGYRVVCLDQKRVHGLEPYWTHIPHGVDDQTGDRPLQERARWLKHAAFFVGLSSGLSWLAWAAGRPVVLISGFTHPLTEFATPHRVINWNVCNSCWNDVRLTYDNRDFLWCPRQKGTPRQYECTRYISAHMVIGAIQQLLQEAVRKPISPGQARGHQWRPSHKESGPTAGKPTGQDLVSNCTIPTENGLC